MAADKQPPTEPKPEPALLALAREKFGALSRAEAELFRAAEEGREASVLAGDDKQDDIANAAIWPADRALQAECISWVCTDRQASALVTHRGLQLFGMRIEGELDLGDAEIKFPLLAWKCAFTEIISLRDAQLRGLYLVGCQIRSLNAGRAIIDGSVFLRDGFKAKGEVSLLGARIGNNFECDDAQLSNPAGKALSADGVKVEGSVFLRNGFNAQGEVNLVGVTIGGNLECSRAEFSNANGFALNANRIQVGGSVFLRDGFEAKGEVNLGGATIGGQLICDGGKFSNPGGAALSVEASKIEGHAVLRDGFQAQGSVKLVAVTIGTLMISDVIKADPMNLDLRLAKVGTFGDDEASWPSAGKLFLDGFHYERLFEKAPFEADRRKRWLSLQPRDRFRPQPYEQLAAVLRQMGHERDARRIMIEKNRERARFTSFPRQGWWWYNVFGRLIGYGYAPWRAFAMSAAMILLGTFLFQFGSAHDLISPTGENAHAKEQNGQVIKEENERPKISEKYPVFNAFFYSLESFTPLLKLDQSANWRPNANRYTEISSFHLKVPAGSLLRYYLYFHIAAGWLLTSLWVGAVTGLVKT